MEKTRRNVLQDPKPPRGAQGAVGQDPREGLRAGVALMAPGDGKGWHSQRDPGRAPAQWPPLPAPSKQSDGNPRLSRTRTSGGI